MRRRTRWLVGLLGVALALVAIAWLGFLAALPVFVRSKIAGIFSTAGLTDATFELGHTGLWETSVENISASAGQLRVANITVSHRPLDVLAGRVDTIHIRDVRLRMSLDNLPQGGGGTDPSANAAQVPMRRVELESAVLTLQRQKREVELSLNGSIQQEKPGESWQVNIAGALDGSPIRVAGTITESRAADLVLSAERLDLHTLMQLASDDERVAASGSVSVRLPIKVDWPRVTLGEGFVQSNHIGTLQLAAVSPTVGGLLDQSDQRFADDPQMTQIKQGVLDALADFEYDQLRADLTRGEGALLVTVWVRGRGRSGTHQELALKMNFRGLEEGLNHYLAARSRVLNIGK